MADPIFTLSSTNPFGLSNAGNDSSPTLVDIDGDSDLDAFIGNGSGNTLFFRNNGTTINPAFAVPATNPFGLRDVGFSSSPSFVDIDHDGDLDALIGNGDGNILFFRNTGSANTPAFAASVTNPFGLVDVGYDSKPAFADIDGDGDQDVFVCAYNSDVQFFRNTGTASNPAFTAASTTFGLGSYYYSELVFVDIDDDGDLDAFEGYDGHFSINTIFYRNIGTVSNPVFDDPSSIPFGLTNVDLRSSPSFVDIDNDGDFDGFFGGRDGNTAFFVNNGLLVASTAGNNVLTGTPSPNDTATYASAGSGVTVSLLLTAQQNTVGAGLDTLTNIENLIGSKFNDNLTGDMKNNILTGGAGNDTLRGWNGADTMNGGVGNDSYFVENAGDK
ncbi:MAG: FG-GAP-like repeat-containing protein, partial [Nitrosomonas sp.]